MTHIHTYDLQSKVALAKKGMPPSWACNQEGVIYQATVGIPMERKNPMWTWLEISKRGSNNTNLVCLF